VEIKRGFTKNRKTAASELSVMMRWRDRKSRRG